MGALCDPIEIGRLPREASRLSRSQGGQFWMDAISQWSFTKTPMHHHLRPPPSDEYVRSFHDQETGALCLPRTREGTVPVFRLGLRALFGLAAADDQRFVTRILGRYKIQTPHGTEELTLNYEGNQLGQYDLDVFLGLVRLVKDRGLGVPVQVSGRQLLEQCELSSCGDNYARLQASLRRLWRAREGVEAPGRLPSPGSAPFKGPSISSPMERASLVQP